MKIVSLTILAYKVAETGKKGVEVNAKNTSQICSERDKQKEQKLKLEPLLGGGSSPANK